MKGKNFMGLWVFRLPQAEIFETKNNMPRTLAKKYNYLKVHCDLSFFLDVECSRISNIFSVLSARV